MSGGALLGFAKALDAKAHLEAKRAGMNIRARMQELQIVGFLVPKPNHGWELTQTGELVCLHFVETSVLVSCLPEVIETCLLITAKNGRPTTRNDFIKTSAELIDDGRLLAEAISRNEANRAAVANGVSLDSIWCLLAAKTMQLSLVNGFLHKVCAGRDGICLVRGNR